MRTGISLLKTWTSTRDETACNRRGRAKPGAAPHSLHRRENWIPSRLAVEAFQIAHEQMELGSGTTGKLQLVARSRSLYPSAGHSAHHPLPAPPRERGHIVRKGWICLPSPQCFYWVSEPVAATGKLKSQRLSRKNCATRCISTRRARGSLTPWPRPGKAMTSAYFPCSISSLLSARVLE